MPLFMDYLSVIIVVIRLSPFVSLAMGRYTLYSYIVMGLNIAPEINISTNRVKYIEKKTENCLFGSQALFLGFMKTSVALRLRGPMPGFGRVFVRRVGEDCSVGSGDRDICFC